MCSRGFESWFFLDSFSVVWRRHVDMWTELDTNERRVDCAQRCLRRRFGGFLYTRLLQVRLTRTGFPAGGFHSFRNGYFFVEGKVRLRGAWSDRDTNDIFAHCSLIFYYLDFKFSNFVCPSELHPLIWFFLKNSFRKKKNIRKTSQNALTPSIFIVWSIVLKLGTPLLHIQVQNMLLQNF